MKIAVVPQFDPIKIDVTHQVWDLPQNRGKVYRRHWSSPPVILYCVQDGTPSETPGTATPEDTGTPTDGGRVPRRGIETPGGRIKPDGVMGPSLQFSGEAKVRIVSLLIGNPTLVLDATPDANDVWTCPDCVQSGDLVELQYEFRDIFGRRFGDMIDLAIPDSLDPAAPALVEARQPVLLQTDAEFDPSPDLLVEVLAFDLGSFAFGDLRPVAGLQVGDPGSGAIGFTDDEGRFVYPWPRLRRAAHDRRSGRPLLLGGDAADAAAADQPDPPSGRRGPVAGRPRLRVDDAELRDGRLAIGSGRIDKRNGELISHVGAVSDIAPEEIQTAEWRRWHAGTPMFPPRRSTGA